MHQRIHPQRPTTYWLDRVPGIPPNKVRSQQFTRNPGCTCPIQALTRPFHICFNLLRQILAILEPLSHHMHHVDLCLAFASQGLSSIPSPYSTRFPKLLLMTLHSGRGGWSYRDRTHFRCGGADLKRGKCTIETPATSTFPDRAFRFGDWFP